MQFWWFYGPWDWCKARLALAPLPKIQACVQLGAGLGLGDPVVLKISILTLQELCRWDVWEQSERDAQM